MTTAIWTMIKFLPIEYHTPDILIDLGNSIGKTVALDVGRSSYAFQVRICIEVDLSTKLPKSWLTTTVIR